MKKIIVAWLLLSFCSCMQRREVNRIDQVVDSLISSCPLNTKIMSVFEKDMGEYFLYVISNSVGIVYDEGGNLIVSEIRHISGKDILFYSSQEDSTVLDETTLLKLFEEEENVHHSLLWYYAVCKDGSKDMLVQAANAYVAPYEIPEIRNFSCTSTSVQQPVFSNEIIVDDISAIVNDSLGVTDIGMIAKVYNRTSVALYNELPSETFVFIDSADTILCDVEKLSLNERIIDDTLWKDNTALICRYNLHFTMKNEKRMSYLSSGDSIKSMLRKSIYLLGYNSSSDDSILDVIIPQEIRVNLSKDGRWIE